MWKKLTAVLTAVLFLCAMSGCGEKNKTAKIGVSFGVGKAARWEMEKNYMEERAKEIGAEIETRLNITDEPTQEEDCKELIDSGIDVLILTPRDINNVSGILEYAKKKQVKVISYARPAMGDSIDLYVGYDSNTIGQKMGQYLAETVYKGDYILLRGDKGDFNTSLLYEGAMKYLDPLVKSGDIKVLLDDYVTGWSPDTAKQMVYDAVKANGNKVDAILAPNDKLAGASLEALQELGVTAPVAITGMDTELDAVKRIVAGTQGMTEYLDLHMMARKAIDEADNMAKGKELDVNAEFDNGSESNVDAFLINGQVVVKENIDKVLIETGYFTKEEVYGE